MTIIICDLATDRGAAAVSIAASHRHHNIMTTMSEAGVLGHITSFLTIPHLLILASAFPSDESVVDYLMHTAEDALPDNVTGWQIRIRNSRLNDKDIHRLLNLINIKSNMPLSLFSLDCDKVTGIGLAPLLYCTQLKRLDLQSLTNPPCSMVFSEVISTVIGVMSHRKLKYLSLPDGWLEEAGRRIQFHGGRNDFRCVGSCCISVRNSSSSARAWCHQCGCGPFCDSSASLVHCKATNFKSCKPCWGQHQLLAMPCNISECDAWHCACGCNDENKKICFDCGEDFYCCIERCGYCSNFTCMHCMDYSFHHNGGCMSVCDVCDGEFHNYCVEYVENLGDVCKSCIGGVSNS